MIFLTGFAEEVVVIAGALALRRPIGLSNLLWVICSGAKMHDQDDLKELTAAGADV
jgi:hypothetical protein